MVMSRGMRAKELIALVKEGSGEAAEWARGSFTRRNGAEHVECVLVLLKELSMGLG